jgi:methyl-accepting chemotaxis protein
MKSAEKMRMITQQVERSSQEQARGGRQITASIEQISNMVGTLSGSQRVQTRTGEQLLELVRKMDELGRAQVEKIKGLKSTVSRLERAVGLAARG